MKIETEEGMEVYTPLTESPLSFWMIPYPKVDAPITFRKQFYKVNVEGCNLELKSLEIIFEVIAIANWNKGLKPAILNWNYDGSIPNGNRTYYYNWLILIVIILILID